MVLFFSLTLYIVSLSVIYMTRIKNTRHFYLIITIGLLTFLSAVRGSSIGNDTIAYLNIFSTSHYLEIDFFNMRYEAGYVLLNKALYFISTEPQIILIVSSILIGLGFYRFINKYSMIPMLSVFLFFTLGYWGQMMNTIRQSLAIVILFFAFDFIKKRKVIPFLLVVLIGTLFHRSAIIFLIAYPISYMRVNRKTVFLALVVSISGYLLFQLILNQIFSIFPLYEYYLGSIYLNGDIRLATIIHIIIVFLVLAFGILINIYREKGLVYKNQPETNSNNFCNFSQKDFDIMSMFLLFNLVISIISLKFNLLDRVGVYFETFIIVYLPNVISWINNKNLAVFITIVIILAFFGYATTIQILRPEWNHIYPYDFFW